MKKLQYAEQGGTTACTLRLAAATKHNGQQRLKKFKPKTEHVRGDSWFAGVHCAEKMAEMGIEFGGPVKTNHKGFPKTDIEEKMKHWPSGSQLVMECTMPTGVKLIAVGYKYNSKKVLSFVFTANCGLTLPGVPYVARFNDRYGNVVHRDVPRPQVISEYFSKSNVIDAHNHIRQHELGLEELWVTQDCWFRLDTTFIGITVTDCLKAYRHGLRRTNIDLTTKEFAERLAFDCMHNPFGNALGAADFIGDKGEDQGRAELVEFVNPTGELSPEQAFVHAMNKHRFAKTSRKEGVLVQRKVRLACRHPKCSQRVSTECTHPACLASSRLVGQQYVNGVFFCADHQLDHVKSMAKAYQKSSSRWPLSGAED
jgi:Transposase IS4